MNIGLVCFVTADFANNSWRQKTHNSVFNSVFMIVIVDVCSTLQISNSGINININCNFQGTFALAAVNCENAVRLNLVQRLAVIPVHFVGRCVFCNSCILSLRNNTLCLDCTGSHIKVVNSFAVRSFLGNALCNDVFCSGEGVCS